MSTWKICKKLFSVYKTTLCLFHQWNKRIEEINNINIIIAIVIFISIIIVMNYSFLLWIIQHRYFNVWVIMHNTSFHAIENKSCCPHETHLFKGAVSGLFGNWKSFKNGEKCFLFHLKSSFHSRAVFLSWLFGHVAKRLDK